MTIPQANPADSTVAANPSNAPAKRVSEATRVPMTLPQLRLSIPDIPGFHLHWFLGQNVPRALKAGYEFVAGDEVEVTNKGLSDDPEKTGSTDMGTRVSVVAGDLIEGTTEPQRLYLMKLRQEWRDKDVAALEAVNERIAATIRGGKSFGGPDAPQETSTDQLSRYLKKGQDLFIPKRR